MATFYVGTTAGDFATIQEAINSELVNSGDTIIVQGSEYTLTDEKIVLSKAINLQAEGSVTVDRMGIGTAAGDFSVKGFTFNPTKNGIYQTGVQNFNLTVEDCTFDLTNVASGTADFRHIQSQCTGFKSFSPQEGCQFASLVNHGIHLGISRAVFSLQNI